MLSEINDNMQNTFFSLISNCPESTQNNIKNILPKLRAFAQNVNSKVTSFCSKFYGGATSFQGYDNSNPNNLFKVLKSKMYLSNSQCDIKILKESSNLIKSITDLPQTLVSYIQGSLNCHLLKDLIYRLNFVLCTNFRASINAFFLMTILITCFEILIIFLITFINRTLRVPISKYSEENSSTTVNQNRESVTNRDLTTIKS